MFVVSERGIFHYMTRTFTVNNVLFFLTSAVGIKHSSGISEWGQKGTTCKQFEREIYKRAWEGCNFWECIEWERQLTRELLQKLGSRPGLLSSLGMARSCACRPGGLGGTTGDGGVCPCPLPGLRLSMGTSPTNHPLSVLSLLLGFATISFMSCYKPR